MTNTLLDVSGKLDAAQVEVIARVNEACEGLGIPLMLVGALARDIHFLYGHGIPVRDTRWM